jgi:hypothetical protein
LFRSSFRRSFVNRLQNTGNSFAFLHHATHVSHDETKFRL